MNNWRNNFDSAAAEAVREELRTGAWQVHSRYDAHPRNGDLYALARRFPLGHEMARKTVYMPLADDPELFLKFAALADSEITQDGWLKWIHYNGVLGLARMSIGYAKARTQGGPEETLSRFAGEARAANKALRLYEAAMAPTGPDTASIEQYISEYDRQYIEDTSEGVTAWAREEAATIVQRRLVTECHPQLYEVSGGRAFESVPDFTSLLGAMHLQMMFLMTASDEKRYCKAPGCNRIIAFEHPDESPHQRLERLGQGRRKKKYKTRVDKETCDKACYMRWRYWQNKRRTG